MANIKRANTSGITKSGVAIADVPDTPTIGSATAGIESATVTYTAATTGGTATTFTATSTPGSVTGTGSSPITVAGLTADTSYTFTVRASNSTGNSPFSAASNSVTALSKLAFESIATYTVGGTAQTSITFSSIPQTFKHLQLRTLVRSSTGASPENLAYVRFNSDTGNNYAHHFLLGTGAVAASTGQASIPYIPLIDSSNSGTLANVFAATVADILDYTNTNKNTTARSLAGIDANGSGAMFLCSGFWNNTAAVTSITIVPEKTSFVEFSSFALYGIKG